MDPSPNMTEEQHRTSELVSDGSITDIVKKCLTQQRVRPRSSNSGISRSETSSPSPYPLSARRFSQTMSTIDNHTALMFHPTKNESPLANSAPQLASSRDPTGSHLASSRDPTGSHLSTIEDDCLSVDQKPKSNWTPSANKMLENDLAESEQLTYLFSLAEKFYRSRWTLVERIAMVLVLLNVLSSFVTFLSTYDSVDSWTSSSYSIKTNLILSIITVVAKFAPNYLKYSKKMLEYHDYSTSFRKLVSDLQLKKSLSEEDRGDPKIVLENYQQISQKRPERVPNSVIKMFKSSVKFSTFSNGIKAILGIPISPSTTEMEDDLSENSPPSSGGLTTLRPKSAGPRFEPFAPMLVQSPAENATLDEQSSPGVTVI